MTLQTYFIYVTLTSTIKIQNIKSKPFQKNGGNLFGNQDQGSE